MQLCRAHEIIHRTMFLFSLLHATHAQVIFGIVASSSENNHTTRGDVELRELGSRGHAKIKNVHAVQAGMDGAVGF